MKKFHTIKVEIPKWTGAQTENPYAGKSLADLNGAAVVPELWALDYYRQLGYDGVWADTQLQMFLTAMPSLDKKIELSADKKDLLVKIHRGTALQGTWDLFLWKGDEIKFVEVLNRVVENMHSSKITFYQNAQEQGIGHDQFEIFKWSFHVGDPLLTLHFPATQQRFMDYFAAFRKEGMHTISTKNGIFKLLSSKPIDRLLGKDEAGVLYIGEGHHIVNYRGILDLIKAINKPNDPQIDGMKLSNKFLEEYPLEEMSVEVQFIEEYRELANKLLEDYVAQFGELPPFNRALPN